MAIYYSPSAKGFFTDDVHSAIPDDKVEITTDVWQHLISNQSGASVISADAHGNPVLIDPAQDNRVVYTSAGQT